MVSMVYEDMGFPPGTLDYVHGVVRCAHCHIFLRTCGELRRNQAATTICAKSSGWYRATTGPKKWSCLGCWRSGIARRTTQFDDIPRCCQVHWVSSQIGIYAREALAIEDDAADIVPPAPPTWLPPARYAAPPPAPSATPQVGNSSASAVTSPPPSSATPQVERPPQWERFRDDDGRMWWRREEDQCWFIEVALGDWQRYQDTDSDGAPAPFYDWWSRSTRAMFLEVKKRRRTCRDQPRQSWT